LTIASLFALGCQKEIHEARNPVNPALASAR